MSSIIERFIKSRFAPASWERPDDVLTKLTVSDLYGIDFDALEDVTRSDALQIPAVKKIRDRMVSKMGAFPLEVMKGSGPYESKYWPAWVETIDEERTRLAAMAQIVDGMIFYGRSFLLITKTGQDGRPEAFRIVPEHKAKASQNGLLLEAFGEKVNPSKYVRIDAHHAGILNDSQDVLKRAKIIADAATRAADNPVPTTELHQTGGTDLTDAQIDALIGRWAAARRKKNGGVSFTSQDVEAKFHGAAPENLLVQGRNQSAIEVANIMGAPAWVIDAQTSGSSLTYSNITSRSREFIEDTLQPYMDAITQRLSLDDILGRGIWLRLDTSTLIREDFRTRMTGYKTAIDAGIYSKEECRNLEDGIPLERGDEQG